MSTVLVSVPLIYRNSVWRQ